MNYDIDTEEGMKNAVRWTQTTLDNIKDGGKWVIPRSATVVTVDHVNRKVYILAGHTPEPDTERVIKAMGWEVTYL